MTDDGTETVSFVQYLEPGIQDGRFTVTVEQAVTVTVPQKHGAPVVSSETFQTSQDFYVTGPRTVLGEADVVSVFPPVGAQGEFVNVLPHLILTDPTLPWQRALSAGQQSSAPGPAWIALLLFDESDPPPARQATTLAQLMAPRAGTFFPPAWSIDEVSETAADPVTVIDVPLATFQAIAPTAADLGWLAHAKQVATDAKPASPGTMPAAETAVVIGNRLPAAGSTSTVFAVSLEGYGDYLPVDVGSPAATFPTGTQAVRLIALRSWSFQATIEPQTFAGLLANIDVGTLQFPVAAGQDAPPATVADALALGYTALNHSLRDGSQTVSWYRGPLAPQRVNPSPPAHYESPDALLRYDPTTGMFDTSYAAAWQLGRLMALHDRAFATALYRWKLALTQQAAAELEGEILDASLPWPVDAPDPELSELPHAQQRFVRAVRDVVGPAAARIAAHDATSARSDRSGGD